MDIEFDPAKDEANVAKHGVSLALGVEMDMETAKVVVDDRRDYGEQRFNALGLIGDRVYAMTFAIRPPAVRIISLRKANSREQKRFTA
ncbi:MAG: BrnT family toxin [Brevundimonas sp.]